MQPKTVMDRVAKNAVTQGLLGSLYAGAVMVLGFRFSAEIGLFVYCSVRFIQTFAAGILGSWQGLFWQAERWLFLQIRSAAGVGPTEVSQDAVAVIEAIDSDAETKAYIPAALRWAGRIAWIVVSEALGLALVAALGAALRNA